MTAPLSQEAATTLAEITVTQCDRCDYLHPSSKSQSSHLWMCSRHPRLPGFTGFVTGAVWEKDPPFLYCRMVNGGLCPLFTPKREPTNGDA
jgi:hypothetical protein